MKALKPKTGAQGQGKAKTAMPRNPDHGGAYQQPGSARNRAAGHEQPQHGAIGQRKASGTGAASSGASKPVSSRTGN